MTVPTSTRPWLGWYNKVRWAKRAKHQLKQHPLCVMCMQEGMITTAKVADHVIPHRGDYMLFWFGELQSLCSEHHSSSKQQLEHKGFVGDIGCDGFPIDDKHPFNKASMKSMKRYASNK